MFINKRCLARHERNTATYYECFMLRLKMNHQLSFSIFFIIYNLPIQFASITLQRGMDILLPCIMVADCAQIYSKFIQKQPNEGKHNKTQLNLWVLRHICIIFSKGKICTYFQTIRLILRMRVPNMPTKMYKCIFIFFT